MFLKHHCYMLCLVLYCRIQREISGMCSGGIDLPKLLDNHIKVCFLCKHTHWRQLTCSLYTSRYLATRRPRTVQYKTHSNRTPTGTSMRRVFDVTSVRTYMYEHDHHGIPWRLSTCANSVYQVLFLLPLLSSSPSSAPGNETTLLLYTCMCSCPSPAGSWKT